MFDVAEDDLTMLEGTDELLKAEDVAAMWHISPALVRQPSWRRRHGLRAVRIGRLLRFERAAIAAFCERQREKQELVQVEAVR